MIFGGEALEMGTVRGWLERHGEERPQLVNMYGITETTVHVTYQRVTAELACGSASVIGVKIPDLQLYVLEEGMEPAAIGVVGELYVGGGGVARGYLGRAELTAERFVPHPYSEVVGERLYRSGDLGRYRADGTVEYLGRMDHQVKIHGHRIELGEIETMLQRHGAVSQAAVVAREEHGEKRLVSYVVYREGEDKPSAAELRQHLQKDLPEYMVPWAYVEMERLPLTTNGKLDRKALPTPERGGDEKRYVAPRNSAEETLCGIWAGVLGVERVGIEDNFFELGGDSILSIQVVAQGRTAGLKFNLRQIFEYQTIAALVAGMEKEQEQQGVVEDSPVRVAPFQLISEEDRKRLPEEVEDAYPLSKLQAGMLFHSEFSPEIAIYHDIFSYYLKAPLDLGSLRRAVLTIVIRHPVLRTSFDFSHYSEPLQLIHCAATIPIQVDDIRGLSLEEQEAATARWIEAEKHRPFDSAVPGLLRIHIHKRSAGSFEFHFSFHHMILDGWSVASLLTELFGCYLAELKGEEWKVEELGSSFREFVALERETMKSAETRRYWEKQLEDVSAPEMPWTGRQAGGSGRGSVKVEIGEELSAGLKGRAQEIGVSLKTVLLAAHMRVLGMLSSGKQDVITGLVSNGRVESSDGERVLGLFLNTVPLWMGLKGGRWLDLMRETAAAEGALLAHRRYPLAELQRQAGVGILFDVTFNFTNFHVYRKLEELGLQVLDVAAFEQTNFVLVVDFNLGAFSPEVHLKLDYDRALIEERQIEAIAQYYQNTLRAMVARPEERYETAELLTEAESQQLLIEWNVRRVEYREACVHELFEEQVTRMPAALALEYKNEKLTYTELNRRANQVAHYLRHLGVGSEVPVGMCMERSLEMVVGLLGILKAGGAYVPLDPEYPVERLKYMLENAEITVLLTQQKVLSQLPEVHVPKSLALDDQWQQIARESDQNLRANAGPQNLAYLIYTSGSTGRPKGVAITHKALSNHMQWMQEEFGFHSRDRILQKTPVSFDASVWEFYAPLLSGGQLVMLEPGGHRDAVELGRKIVQAGITVAQMVPTLMNAVIAAGGMRAGTGKLRLAVCGGEELKAELAEQIWQAIKGVEVVNLYGPTETTIDASYWRGRSWKKGGSIPIGKPVSNLGLYVLDGYMQPVPVGVRGELYIRGTGLARGYWQSPELTAEKFVPNPFSANGGERLYRTGDLVRWSRDGNLEFVGRKDQQVKIRGQRIELKEIEAALLEQEEVKEAVVVVREHTPGDKRLVAYYTAGEKGAGREVRAEELCQYLEERLPGYMVPGAYVRLEKLPLMPNGKLDRKSLPEPDKDLREEEYVGPRNATEETLCRLWQEVLRRERVGIHDNFFDTGGHSLLAIQVISRIKLAFSIEMPLSVLFTAPTVARMAEHIAAVSEPDRSQLSPVLVNIQPHGSLPPFFCVHAVGGQVISYGELSQELGHEQPFYGLQSPPADLFPASDVSIEQMATLYIREIRAVQPVGPYLLGGWSMGGLVAWEMAQQLAKQGERIKLLALIDTIPLSRCQLDDDNTDEIFMLARFALDMSRLVGRDPAPLAQRFSQSTEQDQWNMVQDALISYGVLSPMTAHTEMTGLLDVFTRNFLAGKNYIASPNNQQVVFFRASETPEHLAEPWTTLAVGGIHFHSVPGDHFTILTQPTVRIIADLLQEYVLKAYEQPLQAFSSKCGNEALIIQKGEEILG
ncbi:MAG TPA: amino acid adenylation domain-containing protein [Candidatus Angelobacter sp.]|nr:amino acid adenylation domain-containing protein [Candidatus Angelobacter sp.]